ncbi:acVLRF1 family peptidyl-tRNA hydrolase [Mumia quercus]|uniref:acVLRF1 family peptidyl-tRNA hydrolase n=1 Tax=Mumia quercus TaxID=2976125 RepID=UPI0021D1D16D|nr:acVLRF1 family peptidyl-tRNA hydrolase [Mumia quercus]
MTRTVLVPYERFPGWVERFSARHGEPLVVRDGTAVTLRAPDGAEAAYDEVEPPNDFGIVLVRRGGYAVGWVEQAELVGHKTGTRYVQGQTKAGGWSQQRYARRRANQADALVGACAEVVGRIVPGGQVVFGGGDQSLVAAVLEQAASRPPLQLASRWLDVGEPRFVTLQKAVVDARSYVVRLNALA